MFEVNQRVWDIRCGWGTIWDINNLSEYPINVVFDKNKRTRVYTRNGKDLDNDMDRCLFFQEIVIPIEALATPKWRAEISGYYYYVDCTGNIIVKCEENSKIDYALYRAKNYFMTADEAEKSEYYILFYNLKGD